MPSFIRNTAGGKAISGGSLAPRSRRDNSNQVNSYWAGASLPPLATGGSSADVSISGTNYRILTFTSTSTLTIVNGGDFEYMMFGGGGNGGESAYTNFGGGDGGNAAAATTGTVAISADQTITIGGAGSTSSIGSLVSATGGATGGRSSTGGTGAGGANSGKNGGPGYSVVAFTGTATLYGGGGGAGYHEQPSSVGQGSGGSGGGGDGGGQGNGGSSASGRASGGGGGAGDNVRPGGSGTGGIVLIRFKI